MKTLVIQSCDPVNIPGWINRCLESVQHWSEGRSYDYRFVGDEIFDCVPGWYLEKVRNKGPVATDYARLVLLQQALKEDGYECAIWLDADVYIMDPAMTLDSTKSCAFGQEVWVQEEAGGLRARKNVHNAVCLFRHGCVVLPFLIEAVASIIRRADPAHISPQMVGPKLLGALHSLVQFDLLPQVGAISPEVARDLMAGGGQALVQMRENTLASLMAVNLCSSLLENAHGNRVIDALFLLGEGDRLEKGASLNIP